MKNHFRILLIALTLLFVTVQQNQAQYANKKVRSKHQIYTDSLKSIEYNYVFPILGQGAYSQGFDIPYPIGLMSNFIWMDQGIVIDNMQLGLQTDSIDIPSTAIDFIEFGENSNTSYSFSVRPDIWILPFLNVYGLFGYGHSKTEVNLVAPVALKSVVEQAISTVGIGVMGAGGIGPLWISVDANFTWNKPELLEEATRVNVLGLRLGHTIVNKHKPDRNFAFWAGGMRLKMSTETVGNIKMIDALPQETWDKRDEIADNYWEWYDGLDPNKPLDAKKIEKADEVLNPIINRLENADGDAVISYAMDKQTKSLWNGVIGMQYQLNKNWQFRTEGGIIGDRKSFLFSVNYRFLGFHKKSH